MRSRSRCSGHEGGFTLLELMMVVTVMSIIAAIAVPSMLEARKRANETAAIASLRKFHTTHQAAGVEAAIGGPRAPAQYDGDPFERDMVRDGTAERQGYRFTLLFANPYTYRLIADPITPGRSGDRYYSIDESGVIRYSTAGPARPSSPSLDQAEPPPSDVPPEPPPVA